VAEYSVIFRACDAVEGSFARPYGFKKVDVCETAFASLHRALQSVPHQIHVVGDRLSDRLLDFFARYRVGVTNGNVGNAGSLLETCRRAFDHPDDTWVYLCEDDYFHRPETFVYVDELVRNRQEYLKAETSSWYRRAAGSPLEVPLFLSLHDDRCNYRVRKRWPSWIFRSAHTHWRQVRDSTFTFLAEARSLRRFSAVLERSAAAAEDRDLSRSLYAGIILRRKALCLAPLPGLALQLQDGQISPGVDWEPLVRAAYDNRVPGADHAAR
jgi:hypothetical protein